jgi:type IV pilus assembly protein PilQ
MVMKLQLNTSLTGSLLRGFVALLFFGQLAIMAEDGQAGSQIIEPETDTQASEFVTINVKNANIAEVLKAYSLQTGQSIVVGPDVVSDNVNVRLNNIPWEEALDVILKPYGFGYRVVGDTIVISKLENIVTVEGIEPLVSKVFNLKYLDAYDVREVCEAQLSNRGKFTILSTKSLPGWEFGGIGSGGAATDAGIRKRKKKEEIQKSKVFVITDVPSAVTKVERILEQMDVLPQQVLIEAKFLEISNDGLSDIGLEYISGVENVVDGSGSGTTGLSPLPIDLREDLLRVLSQTTGYVDPLDSHASGSFSHDTGIRLSHSVLGDWGADMLFAFMKKDDDVNILSAPQVLTMNNQEAAILVGEKFPIIESESTSGSGSGITSTSLDYYENIGIQLNVIPQVCDDGYVNMVVHPAVSEIKSFEAGVVTGSSGSQSGSRYPVLKIREAETQIMIKSENTAIIGGLQNERDKETIKKIPFLGDIPFLGRLFRRETLTKEKVDLLIFIKASIVENEAYAAASKEDETTFESKMQVNQPEPEAVNDVEDAEDAEVVEGAEDVEVVEEAEAIEEVEESETSASDVEQIVALVEQMDAAATNQAGNAQL